MLLTLFPQERPVYPEGRPSGDRMEISLSSSRQRMTAACVYRRGAERFCGRASTPNACLGGKLSRDRICQRLVKNAMYRAALASGVSEDVLAAGRAERVQALRDLERDPAALEAFWLEQDLLGLELAPDEYAAFTQEAAHADVVAAAQGVECDAVLIS